MDIFYNQEENDDASLAAEPSAAFSTAYTLDSLHCHVSSDLSDAYMTLEQFGELFHQKFDSCYEDLQRKGK